MMMQRMLTRRSSWLVALLLVTVAVMLLMPALALAEDAEPAAEETAAAPELDYTFAWPSFLLTLALVLGYYVFIFRMSEKEFKGVIAERFGPKRT